MSRKIDRRSVLRGMLGGAGVALALPALESLVGERKVIAAGEAPIFGVFFWGGGMPWHAGHGEVQGASGGVDLWTPTATGEGYAPSELLSPLAAHQPTVITGLTPHTEVPPSPPGQEDGHMRGFMVALTGDRIRPEGFDHPSHTLTALRPTIDQVVAKHPSFYGSNASRYQSLAIGVSTARFHDYGHWNGISYNGPDSINAPIMDPGQLYNLLFAAPPDTAALTRRASLLDAVLADAADVRKKLGAADKQRLDAHLEHLDSIQTRLSFSGAACSAPPAPGNSGDLIEKTGIMAELLALALACNVTRSFSFMLTSPATTHVFSNLGIANDFHTTCHSGAWEQVRAGTAYQMQAFAAFLDKLQATPDAGGGSVLDRSLIFGTSEYGEGYQHSVNELACVMAGGAAGAIRRGVHVRDPGGNFSKAHVTMLRALGLETPSFGFNGGETGEEFAEVLAG
jgi:hypothetical protein